MENNVIKVENTADGGSRKHRRPTRAKRPKGEKINPGLNESEIKIQIPEDSRYKGSAIGKIIKARQNRPKKITLNGVDYDKRGLFFSDLEIKSEQALENLEKALENLKKLESYRDLDFNKFNEIIKKFEKIKKDIIFEEKMPKKNFFQLPKTERRRI